MNGKIVELDASAHQKAQKLLPWLLSESLSGAELALVRKHLSLCQECRDDLAWQRRLRAAEPPQRNAAEVDRAYAALGAQLDQAAPAPAASLLARWRRSWADAGQWARRAMALQGALIVALAVLLVAPLAPRMASTPAPAPLEYRALSAPPRGAPVGNVMVVFKPDTPEREIRRMLQASGARIVDGPTVTDAYVLYLPVAVRDAAVAALRREAAVQLAEPLDRGAPR